MDALQVANELLRLAKDEADNGNGELMTNMKLQKMLYYQQGFHLAVFGTPLFSDNIEAWMYGPVVPCVYHKYECHQANGLLPEADISDIEFASNEERNLFHDVYILLESAYAHEIV